MTNKLHLECLASRRNPWRTSSSPLLGETDCLADILKPGDVDWPAVRHGLPLSKHTDAIPLPSTPFKAQIQYAEQVKVLSANYQRSKLPCVKPSPFYKLSSELVLEVFRHTRLEDVGPLANTCKLFREIFGRNQEAIYRGIEREQYPATETLYGDSTHRQRWQLENFTAQLSELDVPKAANQIFLTEVCIIIIFSIISMPFVSISINIPCHAK